MGPSTTPRVRDSEGECSDRSFRRHNLKLITELPFVGLFNETSDTQKFEASGITSAMGRLWVVFDNLHALGNVDEHFRFRDAHNAIVGPDVDPGDSQYEAIVYVEDRDSFLAVQESFDHEDHGLVPFTHELQLSKDGSHYHLLRECPVHFVLTHSNKGFEGAQYKRVGDRELLVGLCEGNHCVGGSRGKDAGNGRIVVSEYWQEGDKCAWHPIKVVRIPSSADFTDYSDIDIREDGRMALLSQENSALWLGTWDWDTLDFVDRDNDRVLHFPRDRHCAYLYCNVEGVQWLDDARIIVSSDKAKDYQDYQCLGKDQMLSVFALPKK